MSDNAQPHQGRLYANGLSFAIQEWGQVGQLPVLALHGWLDNSASFARIAALLPDIHLVAVDMAGHGLSDHRPGVGLYNFWDDIQDILALADVLEWQEFVILGHSRGAIIGALAAVAFPERIKALALIEGLMPEPVKAENAPEQLASALKNLKELAQKQHTVYPDLETAIKARERGLFPLSYHASSLLTRRGVVPVEGGLSWTSDSRLLAPSAIRLTKEHVDAFLKKLTMPLCLVLATRGLPQLYPNYLELLGHYSHIKYHLLEGGHHLHLEEQYAQVAGHVSGFLRDMMNNTHPYRQE
ncbi:alpha/beta fold hydrolase [Cellvibrio japonicus]|uniref:Hydrolase, alpha/beta fold family n=1 Tax=Cellvibrio japonicus (strain Ueda107) TaxID=498211 RepID=B3PHF9_CELJU|nr:alpha/beta hydrolase [Cellvibrio japonicus]ACE82947.1 hydrolase, alpha/beta fold family [Cellvibrio japonicus Ueda107]QEI12441.1 alpha/beta hydrolase [Cellvibrio japonicus]QEI16014.1 alpha/beta hydrolase [Cellvibrio japonicus]QEI19593.1 alpha/beta hydrolase [Cellvibrio japonicus]